MVVVDVDGDIAPAGKRQAVRASGVERVEGGVGRRGAPPDASGGEQDVAERQQFVLGDVERGVGAELREQVEHARRRAERVGVGLLVDGEGNAALVAHAPAELVEVGGERLHASSSPEVAPASASASAGAGASGSSTPGTRISCASSPSASASRLSARSMRRALSSVSS